MSIKLSSTGGRMLNRCFLLMYLCGTPQICSFFWPNIWPELPAKAPKYFYLSVRNSLKLTYILQIIEKQDTMKVHVHLYVRGYLSRCNSTFLFLREPFKKSNRCVSGSVKIPKNTYNRLVSASDIQLCT